MPDPANSTAGGVGLSYPLVRTKYCRFASDPPFDLAAQAATTQTLRRTMALAGRQIERKLRSGLVNAVHQACRVQEGVHLVKQLRDIERNLDGFADIAGLGAGAGRFRDAGGLFKPVTHLGNVGFQRGFQRRRVHGVAPFATTHALSHAEVEWKVNNLLAISLLCESLPKSPI